MSSPVPALPQKESGTLLSFIPATRQAFQKYLQQLSTLQSAIITELQSQDIKELIKLWLEVNQLERHAWVLKCAISASIWDRTAEAKRGRGNKDVAQRGILAAVSRTSKKLSVTPSTIYLNARIFRLILSVDSVPEKSFTENNILEVLDEKGYWEHALTAADPIKAIYIFAGKKALQPRFKVTDAQRLVLSDNMSRKSVALKAVEAVREGTGKLSARKALVSHIRSAQQLIRLNLIPVCPDKEFRERVWDELLLELNDEYQELFDQDGCDALRKAWSKGAHREDGMVSLTKFPLADVSKLMAVLSDMSEFIRIQPRDIRQRSNFQLWHKVGTPFDNAKYVPMQKKG